MCRRSLSNSRYKWRFTILQGGHCVDCIKLQLIMFFEGIRSERQLMGVAADRLSLRWYLGYDLHEKPPDHSSLSKIRDRYGVTIFHRFFDTIVEQCQQAGLVWGKGLYFGPHPVGAD